jgi:hypothetical protein
MCIDQSSFASDHTSCIQLSATNLITVSVCVNSTHTCRAHNPLMKHYHNTLPSFQGILSPLVVGMTPDTPPLSSQPELAGSNILSISTSQLQALHTVGGAYQPTPVSDAPGLFEQSTALGHTPLPSLPLDIALAMVAPYNPTPTLNLQHDNNCPLVNNRAKHNDGPSPFLGTAPDSTPLEVRDIYTILLNHLSTPAHLPMEGKQLWDIYIPDKPETLEAAQITSELLQEILENRLGYCSYVLQLDVNGRSDTNFPFNGLELTDYVHALAAALDCGMEGQHASNTPYWALCHNL